MDVRKGVCKDERQTAFNAMNFLPIVERELRVTARRGTTHWGRFALTAVVALVTLNQLATAGSIPPASMARSTFTWLVSGAFILACAACTLTADALSGESREGTLGLLFLTDLRSWDITLGKLASSGLAAFYAGLALVPLLMLPVLAGGVSGPEAARAGVELLAVVLFALAAGLAASAREHERGRALRRAARWLAGTVLLPPMMAWFVPGSWIALLSPITSLRLAHDTEYALAPVKFWLALALQVVHAVLLLLIAGSRLRRSLTEPVLHLPSPRPQAREPDPRESSYSVELPSHASYLAANPPPPPRPPKPRRHGLPEGTAPLEWLVQRQRGQRTLCWIAALMFTSMSLGFLPRLFPRMAAGSQPLALYAIYQLPWVGEALLAWAACRFFFEARRSGELELLLTTPDGAQTLVSAHWAAMRRLLLWPMVLIVTPLLLQGGCSALTSSPIMRSGTATYQLYSTFYAFFRALDLVFVVVAVNWLGMLFGLTLRRLVSAVGMSVGLVAGAPMILHSLLQFVARPFYSPNPGSMGWLFWTLSYFPILWVSLLALTLWARRQLRCNGPAELCHLDWRQVMAGSMSQLAPRVRKWGGLTPGA
jgi:hypothetical protein